MQCCNNSGFYATAKYHISLLYNKINKSVIYNSQGKGSHTCQLDFCNQLATVWQDNVISITLSEVY